MEKEKKTEKAEKEKNNNIHYLRKMNNTESPIAAFANTVNDY